MSEQMLLSSSLQRKVSPTVLKQDFPELSAILWNTSGGWKPFPLEAVPAAEGSAAPAACRAPSAPEPGQSRG